MYVCVGSCTVGPPTRSCYSRFADNNAQAGLLYHASVGSWLRTRRPKKNAVEIPAMGIFSACMLVE